MLFFEPRRHEVTKKHKVFLRDLLCSLWFIKIFSYLKFIYYKISTLAYSPYQYSDS